MSKKPRHQFNKSKDEDKETSNPRNRRSRNTRSRGNQSTRSKAYDSGVTDGVDNDPSWWFGAGQIAMDATSISTFNAAGAKHVSCEYDTDYYSPAGVARFDYIPYYGTIDSSVHPLNMAAKLMYDTINSKNSRNPSYDPSDLMIYVLAVANAWALHSFVLRIVGMFNTFSATNRYWWRSVVESMGIAPIATDNDIVKWRNLANNMALRLNMLAVPQNIAYFQRAIFMNQGVYMDEPTSKSSMYYFCPAAFLQYKYDNREGHEQIGMLQMVETPWHDSSITTPITPAVIETYFNNMVVNLFNDSDINTMSADIIKAFGAENCFRLPQVDSSYTVTMGYSPEVNLQLHNSRICTPGSDFITDPYQVRQNMNYNGIETNQRTLHKEGDPGTALMATDIKAGRGIPLDFPVDNPDNAMVMEATRLTWYAVGVPTGDGLTGYEIQACTELLIGDEFFEFETDSNKEWTLNSRAGCINNKALATTIGVTRLAENLSRSSKYANAPLTWIMLPNQSSAQFLEPQWTRLVSNTSNYTTVSREDLRNMHDAATLSVFVPRFAKFDQRK